jgi:hypothetical protein
MHRRRADSAVKLQGQRDEKGRAEPFRFDSRTRLAPASRVPPVATRSSISSTFCPAFMAPVWISILSVEYSVMYSSLMTSPLGWGWWVSLCVCGGVGGGERR